MGVAIGESAAGLAAKPPWGTRAILDNAAITVVLKYNNLSINGPYMDRLDFAVHNLYADLLQECQRDHFGEILPGSGLVSKQLDPADRLTKFHARQRHQFIPLICDRTRSPLAGLGSTVTRNTALRRSLVTGHTTTLFRSNNRSD